MLFKSAATALFLLLAPLPAFAAEGASGGVTVKAWARATPEGAKVGAAYGEISAKEDDKLVAASSPAAATVEIHTHVHEDGVMKMRRLDALEVKGGETVKLQPGGHHIMLMGLKEPLKDGGSLDLTLTFEKAGAVSVKAPILPVGSKGPESGHEGMDHDMKHGSEH